MLTWPQTQAVAGALLALYAVLQVLALRHRRRDALWHVMLFPLLMVGAAVGVTFLLLGMRTAAWTVPVLYVTPFAILLLAALWLGGCLCDCCGRFRRRTSV